MGAKRTPPGAGFVGAIIIAGVILIGAPMLAALIRAAVGS